MPRPQLVAIILAVIVLAVAGYRFFGSEAAPVCPGESPYCDRGRYVAGAADACAAATGDRERRLIEASTTLAAYCTCISGRMFDAFDAAALWRLDTGGPTGPERTLLDAQAGSWASSCLGE